MWRITVGAATLLAVVAVALSIWALVRTASDDGPSYSSAEQDAARTAVCQAYDLAFRGVSLQTNATAPWSRSSATVSFELCHARRPSPRPSCANRSSAETKTSGRLSWSAFTS